MAFKKIRSVRLPYRRQGLVYFTLLNYQNLPAAQRRRIDSLILAASAGDRDYEDALREWLLRDGGSAEEIALRRHLRPNSLYRMRRKIYEEW